jgi:hypothetical protein
MIHQKFEKRLAVPLPDRKVRLRKVDVASMHNTDATGLDATTS